MYAQFLTTVSPLTLEVREHLGANAAKDTEVRPVGTEARILQNTLRTHSASEGHSSLFVSQSQREPPPIVNT